MLPVKMQANALMQEDKQYAANFFDHGNPAPQSLSLLLLLPAGEYATTWVEVLSGKATKPERVKSSGSITITWPEFQREIALSIRR